VTASGKPIDVVADFIYSCTKEIVTYGQSDRRAETHAGRFNAANTLLTTVYKRRDGQTDRLTDNDLRDITQCSHHTFSLDHEFYSATEIVFLGDAWALRLAEIGISGSLNRSDPL